MPKTKTPKTAARVYRAASYARLSVDDETRAELEAMFGIGGRDEK